MEFSPLLAAEVRYFFRCLFLFSKDLKLLRGLLDQKVPNAEPLFCGETTMADKKQ